MDTFIQEHLSIYTSKAQLLSMQTDLELNYQHTCSPSSLTSMPSSHYSIDLHVPHSPISQANPIPSGFSLAMTINQTSTETSELSSLSRPGPESDRHVFAVHLRPMTILPTPHRSKHSESVSTKVKTGCSRI